MLHWIQYIYNDNDNRTWNQTPQMKIVLFAFVYGDSSFIQFIIRINLYNSIVIVNLLFEHNKYCDLVIMQTAC